MFILEYNIDFNELHENFQILKFKSIDEKFYNIIEIYNRFEIIYSYLKNNEEINFQIEENIPHVFEITDSQTNSQIRSPRKTNNKTMIIRKPTFNISQLGQRKSSVYNKQNDDLKKSSSLKKGKSIYEEKIK